MKKKLAIICASMEQMPLVQKAKEMGIETHCFAWDREDKKKDSECKDVADYFHPISILEKERILEVCQKVKIDGVTSMLNDYAPPTVAYVAHGMGLPGNKYDGVMAAANKFTMRQAFYQHGVNSPRFAIAREGFDITGLRYPLIVKPTDRCASVGVTKVEKEADLEKAIQCAQDESFTDEAIIEEFIEGIEVSVDAISCNGKHYILAIKERELTQGINCYVKTAGHWPYELPSDIQDKLRSETKKALDAIGFSSGASNSEFRVTNDGEVFIVEINPRMAGDYSWILMKLHNGYDIVKGIIDVALGQFEEPVFTETKYAGVYFLCKQTAWVKQVIDNMDKDPDIIEAEIYSDELRDLRSGTDITGHFIYQSAQKRRWGPK